MTITALLTMLALAVGAETTQPTQSYTSACPPGRVCKIEPNCWVNGVWTTPCPEDAPPPPDDPKDPDILLPY